MLVGAKWNLAWAADVIGKAVRWCLLCYKFSIWALIAVPTKFCQISSPLTCHPIIGHHLLLQSRKAALLVPHVRDMWPPCQKFRVALSSPWEARGENGTLNLTDFGLSSLKSVLLRPGDYQRPGGRLFGRSTRGRAELFFTCC